MTSPHRENPKVIVASGDILMRQPLVDFLRDCGFDVIAVATTEEAMALVEAGLRPEFLLADVHSSGKVDGFALASFLRRRLPETEVLLSANLEKTAAKAGDICRQGPEDDKLFDHQMLLKRLKRARAAAG